MQKDDRQMVQGQGSTKDAESCSIRASSRGFQKFRYVNWCSVVQQSRPATYSGLLQAFYDQEVVQVIPFLTIALYINGSAGLQKFIKHNTDLVPAHRKGLFLLKRSGLGAGSPPFSEDSQAFLLPALNINPFLVAGHGLLQIRFSFLALKQYFIRKFAILRSEYVKMA